VTVPATRILERPGKLLPGVAETIMSDLICRVLLVAPRDFSVRVAVFGQITPFHDEGAGGPGHFPSSPTDYFEFFGMFDPRMIVTRSNVARGV
jgi:hypothetical protein